jgi:hypothetical protein
LSCVIVGVDDKIVGDGVSDGWDGNVHGWWFRLVVDGRSIEEG